MRCEAGAVWRKGRVTYACPAPATVQVLLDGEDVLIVYCAEHADEMVPHLERGMSGRVRAEPLEATVKDLLERKAKEET